MTAKRSESNILGQNRTHYSENFPGMEADVTTDDHAVPFAISRRERILNELRRTGEVRVSVLARQLGVSELTIRRDIGWMADKGLVTRVHGGATLRSALERRAPRALGAVAPTLYRVGMVVPSLSYYWPQVIVGARAAAQEGGVQLVLRGASYSLADQRHQVQSLLSSGTLHALIVAPQIGGADGQAMLDWLDALQLPVVLVERRPVDVSDTTTLEWVSTDHASGGAIAAQHLHAQGHRRVGILTSPGSPTSERLRRGWASAVRNLGMTPALDLDCELEAMEGAERAAFLERLLASCRTTGTTALLIHSDPQAVLVQQYARDHGLNTPDDLAIVAYDDEVAQHADPAITALCPPKHHVGRLAVEMLLARLQDGPSRPVQRTSVLPALPPRDSSVPTQVVAAGSNGGPVPALRALA